MTENDQHRSLGMIREGLKLSSDWVTTTAVNRLLIQRTLVLSEAFISLSMFFCLIIFPVCSVVLYIIYHGYRSVSVDLVMDPCAYRLCTAKRRGLVP